MLPSCGSLVVRLWACVFWLSPPSGPAFQKRPGLGNSPAEPPIRQPKSQCQDVPLLPARRVRSTSDVKARVAKPLTRTPNSFKAWPNKGDQPLVIVKATERSKDHYPLSLTKHPSYPYSITKGLGPTLAKIRVTSHFSVTM